MTLTRGFGRSMRIIGIIGVSVAILNAITFSNLGNRDAAIAWMSAAAFCLAWTAKRDSTITE
jgi:hypothetical protein